MIRNLAMIGASGRMGKEITKGIIGSPDFDLTGAVDISEVGADAGTLAGVEPCGVAVTDDLSGLLATGRVDACIDFTNPKVVMKNLSVCLAHRVPMVIGTTGITGDDIAHIRGMAEKAGTNVIIAPNFTIGAVLMMLFAQTAAKYFNNAEIIELHHNNKMDAPSGTALKTAEMIVSAREGQPSPPEGEFEKLQGSRGGELEGVRLHSVRLPGFIAHQEVIFGDAGQILTIRHDSMTRECYVPGVLMAVRRLSDINGVVYGLENLL